MHVQAHLLPFVGDRLSPLSPTAEDVVLSKVIHGNVNITHYTRGEANCWHSIPSFTYKLHHSFITHSYGSVDRFSRVFS